MRSAASEPCVRRAAKSARGRPCDASTQRADLVARQGLVLDLVDDDGLGELRRDDGRGHFQDRFIGEEQSALGHRADAAGEPELAQVAQEILGKHAGVAQVLHAVVVERQGGQAIERAVHAGGDQVATPGGILAHEKAESGFAVHPLSEVGLRHGQFVEIGEQTDVAGRHGKIGLFAVADHGNALPPTATSGNGAQTGSVRIIGRPCGGVKRRLHCPPHQKRTPST